MGLSPTLDRVCGWWPRRTMEHSLSFRSRERLFLPEETWQRSRRVHYQRLGLPQPLRLGLARRPALRGGCPPRSPAEDRLPRRLLRPAGLPPGTAARAQPRRVRELPQACSLRGARRRAPGQADGRDAGRGGRAEPPGEHRDGLEHSSNAERARPLERGPRPRRSAELIGHVAPTRTEGINLRGVFRFPIERYAEQLLPSSRGSKTALARG